jgi:hypothetical protein
LKEPGTGLSAIEIIGGIVFGALQMIYPTTPVWLRVGSWALITAVLFHVIAQSQWTRRWSTRLKVAACLAVGLLLIGPAWMSLDDGPNIHIVGTLPVHLWETVPGPESVPFVHHRLGFIVKVRNNAVAPAHVDLAVLEGCAKKLPLSAAEGMLIDGETRRNP